MKPTLDFLNARLEQHGDLIALEDANSQVSYTELVTAVNAIAVALQVKDPTPGSPVGLCAENSLEYLVSVLAILAAGKVLLPLNCHASTEQLHELLNQTHPATVIVDALGDERIQSEDELKIRISQFEGLVLTYRGQAPT